MQINPRHTFNALVIISTVGWLGFAITGYTLAIETVALKHVLMALVAVLILGMASIGVTYSFTLATRLLIKTFRRS